MKGTQISNTTPLFDPNTNPCFRSRIKIKKGVKGKGSDNYARMGLAGSDGDEFSGCSL